MQKGTYGWVQGIGQVFIPEERFNNLPDGYYPRLIHGSGHTIAVFDHKGQCVGWYCPDKQIN